MSAFKVQRSAVLKMMADCIGTLWRGFHTTHSSQSALQIDGSKAASPILSVPVFAAELGRQRGHADSSSQGFNSGTRASL